MELNIKPTVILPEGNLSYEYQPLYNDREDDKTLGDLNTEQLQFSLNNPVDIQCQQSYDGSVNLILNDGATEPKLINTRFSVRENNTYERVDRKGNTDTNIYDKSSFDTDISLYKQYKGIPKIVFNGVSYGGQLNVGNYVFYFKLCDADGNETDFIGESGIVSLHIGSLNNPKAIRGGMANENSGKSVSFFIENLDSAYDYVTVYYTRTTSQIVSKIATAHKLSKKFRIKNKSCLVFIDGFENVED